MVATVYVAFTQVNLLFSILLCFSSAVYFHPAKTLGAMIEADLFFLFGVFYASFVCLSAMGVFWWLETQDSYGLEWAGDVFVILWIAISMITLAWMKVRMVSRSIHALPYHGLILGYRPTHNSTQRAV
jgi:hypothetical protein